VALAVGVGFLVASGLGTGPIDALVIGATARSGLALTVISIAVSVVFIAAAWAAGIRPGPGTAVSMLLFAPLLDGFLLALSTAHPLSAPPHLAVGALEWAAGAVLIAAGSALSIEARLGVGAYDAATLAVQARTRLSIPQSRFALDLAVAALALTLGGPIWIGTLALTAAVPFFLRTFLAALKRRHPHPIQSTP